jgi:hypothetical protein
MTGMQTYTNPRGDSIQISEWCYETNPCTHEVYLNNVYTQHYSGDKLFTYLFENGYTFEGRLLHFKQAYEPRYYAVKTRQMITNNEAYEDIIAMPHVMKNKKYLIPLLGEYKDDRLATYLRRRSQRQHK